MIHDRVRTWRGLIRSILLIATIALPAGCQALGAIIDKTAGPGKVPANYKPQPVPMLVLVENYRTLGNLDEQSVTKFVEDEVTANKVAPIVSQEELRRMRDADPDGYRKLSVAALGKISGARQILYVDQLELTIDRPAGSELFKGTASARVRVVDVESGRSLWPKDSRSGEPYLMETPYVHDTDISEDQLRLQLAQTLAQQVVRNFYDWTPEQ